MSCRRLLAAGSALIALGATGCAVLKPHARLELRPVQRGAGPAVGRADPYYDSAVAAIARRDYAGALEFLQLADERSPHDARVLNAFGVVYDKLGRFDLSARYYAQAETADPGSSIVASNEAYSAVLKRRAGQDGERVVVPIPPWPERDTALALQTPPVVRLGPAAAAAVVQRLPAIARGVQLADASGAPNAAAGLRLALTQRGWTVPAARMQVAARPAAASLITYAPDRAAVAQALARTMPYRVRTTPCVQPCSGIRLVVGRDALAWSLQKPRRTTERPA